MDTGRPTVLVVEDEEPIRRFLRASLEAEELRVVEAGDAEAAYGAVLRHHPDLVLLALGLPDMDGVALIERLRQTSRLPILVLSARSGESSKVAALDAGADDYLTKPFGIHELKARVRVALRRLVHGGDGESVARFCLGDIQVDLEARRITRGSETIHLTPIEFRLLATLAREPGRVLTHRTLLREIWGPAYENDSHYLRIYIKQLRRKLEADPADPAHFLTEPGVGYRLMPGRVLPNEPRPALERAA